MFSSPARLQCRVSVLMLTLLALLGPRPSLALCVANSMEGKWINVDPNGVLKSVELRFKCCDQVLNGQLVCRPDRDTVRAFGPCANGNCDWGQVEPHYNFVDASAGNQYTRVDASFPSGGEKKELVILLLGADQILIHWSVDYPQGSSDKDFSLIEYFERQRCVTMHGREFCLERLMRVPFHFESSSASTGPQLPIPLGR